MPRTEASAYTGPRLIQAPMVGATDPSFVISACQAGLLGSLGGGASPPLRLQQEIRAIRSGTDDLFNINLFVIDERIGQTPPPEELAALDAWYAQLGLSPDLPASYAPSFEAQFQVLLDEAPPITSFTFGLLAPEQAQGLQQRGCQVIGTATSPDEALAWQSVGADFICLQGLEAGGHRGPFLSDAPGQPLADLFATCRELIARPLIVAGGLMDGRAAADYLIAGAAAAQLGSAFLCCPEAPTVPAHRQALLEAREAAEQQTVLIRSFSGRQARGLPNAYTRHFETQPVSPYPIRNALTQPLRRWAAQHGDRENLSLWVGQGHRAIRERPLDELAAELHDELQQALSAAGSQA